MYQIIKRDGKIAEFDINKIAAAIKKAFEATDTEYTENIIDFLSLKVTADFLPKIKDGYIAVGTFRTRSRRCFRGAAMRALPRRTSSTVSRERSSAT